MAIEVRNLVKGFGKTRVVEDVSFEVKAGEVVALLGPSGGGKSTVLRMIAGLERPDSGEVFLDGARATDVSVQERNIGFVFQNYALFKHLSVRENIAFGLSIQKKPKTEIDARVDELLELVQLVGLGERFASQLSGGQRQRVALARALAPGPRLLLLDEPFGALDAKVRLELREWIRRLHKEKNITSIFVTHDQEEALDLADRVIVLQKGKVEQIGTPEDIYDRPATEFVASFVGSINVLSGEVKDGRVGLGSLGVDAPPHSINGASVRAFVRPHDVELQARIDSDRLGAPPEHAAGPVATAKIARMAKIGFMVKIELQLSDGQSLAVELTKDRVAELGLDEGDHVMVNVRDAKLFVQDYAI